LSSGSRQLTLVPLGEWIPARPVGPGRGGEAELRARSQDGAALPRCPDAQDRTLTARRQWPAFRSNSTVPKVKLPLPKKLSSFSPYHRDPQLGHLGRSKPDSVHRGAEG